MKMITKLRANTKPSLFAWLGGQQQLFPAQLNLARTQRDELLAVIDLYKSPGGGWHEARAEILKSPNR